MSSYSVLLLPSAVQCAPLGTMNNATDLPYPSYDEYERNELKELRNALNELSPHDFAAWTAWVENRLTDRLRQRQAHGRAGTDDPPEPEPGA